MCAAAVGNNHFSSDNQGVISERGEKTDVSSLVFATLAGTLCPGPIATFQSLRVGREISLGYCLRNCPKFPGLQLKGHLMTDYEYLH